MRAALKRNQENKVQRSPPTAQLHLIAIYYLFPYSLIFPLPSVHLAAGSPVAYSRLFRKASRGEAASITNGFSNKNHISCPQNGSLPPSSHRGPIYTQMEASKEATKKEERRKKNFAGIITWVSSSEQRRPLSFGITRLLLRLPLSLSVLSNAMSFNYVANANFRPYKGSLTLTRR